MSSIRLSGIEVIIDDVINGSVIHVCERPDSVEQVQEIMVTLIEELESTFGYNLGLARTLPTIH